MEFIYAMLNMLQRVDLSKMIAERAIESCATEALCQDIFPQKSACNNCTFRQNCKARVIWDYASDLLDDPDGRAELS